MPRTHLRRRVAAAAGLTVIAACAAVPPGATAAEDVTLTPAQTREMLFVAGDAARLSDASNDADRILERTLQEMYERDGNLDPNVAKQKIQSLKPVAEQAEGDAAPSDGIIGNEDDLRILEALAEASKGDSVSGPAVRAVVEQALVTDADDNGVGGKTLTASIDNQATLEDTTFSARDILTDTLALAAERRRFGEARDLLWQGTSHQSVFGTVNQLKLDPDLAAADILLGHILVDGSMHLSHVEAMNIADWAMGRGSDVTTASRTNLRLIDEAQSRYENAPQDEKAQRERELKELKERVKDEAEQREAIVKNARAVLGGVLEVLERIDPEAAEIVGSIGNTVMKGAEFFNTLADGIGNITVNLAAGNYFGVVKDLFGMASGLNGMFADPQKAANEKIIKNLEKLSTDLAEFRKDMAKRFDRIDKALNTIYKTLNDRFDDMEAKLRAIDGNVRGIFDDLIVTQGKLDQLEVRLYGAIKDAADRDLYTAINTAIGWADRSPGGTKMPGTEFQKYAGLFHSWATDSAFDRVAVVPDPRNWTDDDALLGELTHPLDRNVEFFRKLPAERGWRGTLGNDALPNPRDWAVSSRAFQQLLLENPAQVTQGQLDRLNQTADGGLRLRAAVRKIARADTAEGTKSKLFNRLFALYRAQATSLDGRIEAAERSYKNGLVGHDDSKLNMDIFGAVDQAPDKNPQDTKECSRQLELPESALATNMLPSYVRGAWRLGLGELQVCATANLTDAGIETTTTPNGTEMWTHYEVFDAAIEWRYKARGASHFTTVAKKAKTWPRNVKCHQKFNREGQMVENTCQNLPTALNQLAGGWNANYKTPLSERPTEYDQGQLDAIHAAVAADLKDKQKGMYNRIIGDFLSPSTEIARAAARLTGAKQLLEGYVQLGLPEPYENDGDLRALLAGTERVLDQDADQRLTSLYVSEARNKLPAQNYRPAFKALIDARIDALEQRLAGHVLPAAGLAAGAEPKVASIVETTLSRANLTRYILTGPKGDPKPPPPPPPGDGGEEPGGEQPGGEQPPPAGDSTPATGTAPRSAGTGTTQQSGRDASRAGVTTVTVTRATASRRKGAVVTVRASAPGRVKVRVLVGKRVVGTATATVRRAGQTVTVKVRWSKRAKAKVRRGKKVTIEVALGTTKATKAVKVKA